MQKTIKSCITFLLLGLVLKIASSVGYTTQMGGWYLVLFKGTAEKLSPFNKNSFGKVE
jgi:hypothetical protein